jgi:hypothetical protein
VVGGIPEVYFEVNCTDDAYLELADNKAIRLTLNGKDIKLGKIEDM